MTLSVVVGTRWAGLNILATVDLVVFPYIQ